MLIDSHCHLDFEDCSTERDAIVERARTAGLGRIITISTRTESFPSLSRLADKYRDVFCTVGTHPHNAHEEADVSADKLTALALHPKCVGIGEAGLDYHYDRTPRDVAANVFRNHIAAARNSGLPIVVHARDADADIAAILRSEMERGAFTGLLHCFTSSPMLADVALSLGLYISFSGVLTFKNAQGLRDIARRVPMDRLLIETDAPYLAPVPFRGKRNEPAFVVATAQKLAEVKGVSLEIIAGGTSANALRLFSKMPAPTSGAEAGVSVTFTILGCGSSGGVPRLGQGWGACDPNNPKNRRRRCSLMVERAGDNGAKTQVLVDMSPDLREQLLGLEISHLDAILLTHSHADHINGIDDVRPLVIKARRKIDLFMDAATSAIVRTNFGYVFETPAGSQYPALLTEHRLVSGYSIIINGPGGPLTAIPFQLEHGEIGALGFRFGKIAYTPDVNAIPPESVAFLADLDVWIVDALRYTPHPSHFCLDETLRWIEKLRPARAVLTNLHTDLDFARLQCELPANVEPAFDGKRISA